MERKIMYDLGRWRKDPDRKPLLIYGNKQVGKTYTVLEFANKEYKTVAYINCENNLELLDIIKRESALDKIILKLSLLTAEQILKGDTLIIFDNVQDESIAKMVKRFSKEANDYHIIMITSEKENLMKFKGEELQFKVMFPLDFEEYLKAIGQEQLIEFIKTSYKNDKPMPFHNIAMDHYENFLMTGGYPEAIYLSLQTDNFLLLTTVHKRILDIYQKSFLKMPNLIDRERANEVMDVVPYQLQKPNKKFQYGLMKSGSRQKEYAPAIDYLSTNGFLLRAYKITEVSSPISKSKEKDSFKLYANDTGLLFHQLHLNKMRFLSDDRMKYIIYENALATSISACGYSLYYYQSEGKAEISFVLQTRAGKIIPIELVNKNVSKAKSLTLFMTKFDIKDAIRVTTENFGYKKGVKYVPIYATFCFKENL